MYNKDQEVKKFLTSFFIFALTYMYVHVKMGVSKVYVQDKKEKNYGKV